MQRTIPPLKEQLGCEEPIETAFAAPGTRPGARGPHRVLHQIGDDILAWRCPRSLAQTQFALDGWDAFLWWEKSQRLGDLTEPYPVPATLIEAVRIVRNEYRRAHDEWWDRTHPNTAPGAHG